VLACIGGFLFGYDTSNIGSALGFIPYHPADQRRRHLRHRLDSVRGHDQRGHAARVRTLIGLAIGADSAIATAYIAEFAPRSRRGQLSIIQQWMITVGILVSYLVAVVVLKVAPGSAGGADWRLILGLGGVPALIAVALRSHMPESPRWLMLHGRYDDTRKAFGRLGMDVTEDEVRHAADELAGLERQRSCRRSSRVGGTVRSTPRSPESRSRRSLARSTSSRRTSPSGGSTRWAGARWPSSATWA
jgi:SP family arabinose:H+ symporter-like MFS transporter